MDRMQMPSAAQARARWLKALRSWQSPALIVLGAGIIAGCGGSGGGTQPPGGPANIAANSTTSQAGFRANPPGTLPSVKVTDADGRAAAGAKVRFQVTSGGGSILGALATADANGIATLGDWILGPNPGTNTVDASGDATSLAGAPVTFTVNASTPVSNFTVTLQNIGPPLSPTRQAAFDNAKARWQQVILNDLPDFNGSLIGNTGANCGNQDITGVNIDDVLIFFTLDSIDGPGQILGAAGPCFIRQSNSLTILGIMKFDTADVAAIEANGSLNDVILHEMGHVLGYGTLWTNFGLLQGACNPNVPGSGTSPTYSGTNAVAAFTRYNGGTGNTVLVENFATGGCNNGTRDSHWEETVFQSEVMTGFITGTFRPLSLTSVRQFQDLGYQVDFGAADPFNINTQPSLRIGQTAFPEIPLGNDILNIPLYAVDDVGRVRMIRGKQ